MDDPTCHSKLKGLHPDMSSGAAEIYAASVALTGWTGLAAEEANGKLTVADLCCPATRRVI